MVILLSLLLCGILMMGIVFLLMPDLFPTTLAQRWLSSFHHYRH